DRGVLIEPDASVLPATPYPRPPPRLGSSVAKSPICCSTDASACLSISRRHAVNSKDKAAYFLPNIANMVDLARPVVCMSFLFNELVEVVLSHFRARRLCRALQW